MWRSRNCGEGGGWLAVLRVDRCTCQEIEISQGAIVWWCRGVLFGGGSEERVRRALSFDLELCGPVDMYKPDTMDILELQK